LSTILEELSTLRRLDAAGGPAHADGRGEVLPGAIPERTSPPSRTRRLRPASSTATSPWLAAPGTGALSRTTGWLLHIYIHPHSCADPSRKVL